MKPTRATKSALAMRVGGNYRPVKDACGGDIENGTVWIIKRIENGIAYGVKPEQHDDCQGSALCMSFEWEEVLPQTTVKFANTVETRDLTVGMVYNPLGDATNDIEVVAQTSSVTVGRNRNGDFIMDEDGEWLFAHDPRIRAKLPEPEFERATRSSILNDAHQAVTKDRAATHGNLEDNFSTIAQIWSVRLGRTITSEQVAIMMIDLKTVRAWGNPKHADNWVDAAGYAACGGELADGA